MEASIRSTREACLLLLDGSLRFTSGIRPTDVAFPFRGDMRATIDTSMLEWRRYADYAMVNDLPLNLVSLMC